VLANANREPDIGSLAGTSRPLVLFVAATLVFAHLQATLILIFATGDGARRDGMLARLRKRLF